MPGEESAGRDESSNTPPHVFWNIPCSEPLHHSRESLQKQLASENRITRISAPIGPPSWWRTCRTDLCAFPVQYCLGTLETKRGFRNSDFLRSLQPGPG